MNQLGYMGLCDLLCTYIGGQSSPLQLGGKIQSLIYPNYSSKASSQWGAGTGTVSQGVMVISNTFLFRYISIFPFYNSIFGRFALKKKCFRWNPGGDFR